MISVYNINSMLARSQVKSPIILLLLLSSLSFFCVAGALVYSGVSGYIGILMNASTAFSCSSYLTFKVETLNTYIYNNIFFCACLAAVLLIATIACLFSLLCKNTGSEQHHFPQFSLSTFYLLYILYSLELMATIPAAGYYLTFIIEKGIRCTQAFLLHWLVIGGPFLLAFLLLLVCWIYLFFLKIKHQDTFQQPVGIVGPNKQIEVHMAAPTMGNILDLILMEQRMQSQQNAKQEIKEPLMESVDSEDEAPPEQGDKVKIAYVGFAEYKKKQELLKQKEAEQDKIVQALMQQEQQKREEHTQKEEEERQKQFELKKKLSSMALSPNDADFDKMFEQSEADPPETQQQPQHAVGQSKDQSLNKSPSFNSSQAEEPFYPANYVPIDQEDEKRFKKYKKKLLAKANIKNSKHQKRHLQNIEGGRSRRQLERMVSAYKKPPRTIQYYQNMLKNNYAPSPIQQLQQSDYSSHSSSGSDKNSATFNYQEPSSQQRQLPSMMVHNKPAEIPPTHDISSQNEEKEPSGRLLFEKRSEKSPIRKKLFQEETKYLRSFNMGSVLGTIVTGVIESNPRKRLLSIKEAKESDSKQPVKRKNQKLIDFIRSKYS